MWVQESNKNVNEWVPVSASVFTAPQSHISPMFACAPWHAMVQVVPVWGCPGRVRCLLGSCRLHKRQLRHLLPLMCWKRGVWGHRGVWYVFVLHIYVCVYWPASNCVCITSVEILIQIQIILFFSAMTFQLQKEKLVLVSKTLGRKVNFLSGNTVLDVRVTGGTNKWVWRILVKIEISRFAYFWQD